MKKFLLLLLVSLILTSCYTNGDCTTAVKEAYPDNEIYQIKINEFILVDSIGIWYVNANMGVKEPYTERQLVRLWSNYGGRSYIRQCEMRAMIGIFVLLKFLEE